MVNKHGEKQVEDLESFEFSSKESPSLKYFISEIKLDPELLRN